METSENITEASAHHRSNSQDSLQVSLQVCVHGSGYRVLDSSTSQLPLPWPCPRMSINRKMAVV